MIDKLNFFKYPMTPKIGPTRDIIILDIKSETEFKNYIIGTTFNPKLKTISLHTILHLPPWLLYGMAPHIESKIKALFKSTLDLSIKISHPVTATTPVITPPGDSFQAIQESSGDANVSAAAT